MKKLFYTLLSFTAVYFTACEKAGDIVYPDVLVSFTTTGIGLDDEAEEVSLSFSRPFTGNVDIVLSYYSEDLVYGEHYTTYPEVENGRIVLSVPAGETIASFTIEKNTGYLYEGNEGVTFQISSISASEGISLGTNRAVLVSFTRIVSMGQARYTLYSREGDDASANVVYLDFSANKQYPVDRTSWDLAFYCGNDFKVILNPSFQTVAAIVAGKNDISEVGLADTENAPYLDGNTMSFNEETDPIVPFDVLDEIGMDKDMDGTVFNEIAPDAEENMVYFVASANNRMERSQWYKVKIDRNSAGTGYIIQYAAVTESEINIVEIIKDSRYNFKFLSLRDGMEVEAEPQKLKWDIMYGMGVQSTPFQGVARPYFMEHMIYINNVGGVTVAEVNANDIPFDDMTYAQALALTFTSKRTDIGTNWRALSGIYYDIYYVIRDPDGYYYKMQCIAGGFGDDGSVRGLPVFKYYLLRDENQ